ncbi:hypothetical protein GCM10010275_61490 [Streptomyces litmocidini]|nr:hypothetical protein GCM10010275_61490 [Streptomyces litmocidini]
MEDGRPGIRRARQLPGAGPDAPGAGVPAVPRPRSAPLSESRPHPTDGGVVGTYVHPYDPFTQPYPSPIPAMRPARDVTAGSSPTPIYDALYSEYRRSFRTLPGDRSGEEELSFRAFGTVLSTGVRGRRHASGYPTPWSGQQHPPTQAALPPGPRKGL